jgi:hypothetical protein
MSLNLWFKHPTNLSSESRVVQLVDSLGPKGYGYYVLLLENLFSSVDSWETRPSASNSKKGWAKTLKTQPSSVEAILASMVRVGLINCEAISTQVQCTRSTPANSLSTEKEDYRQNGFKVELRNYLKYLPKSTTLTAKALATENVTPPKEREIVRESKKLSLKKGASKVKVYQPDEAEAKIPQLDYQQDNELADRYGKFKE